jgi:hypothetical protein
MQLWARTEVLQLVTPLLGVTGRPLSSEIVIAAVKKLVKAQTPEGKIRYGTAS